MVMMKKIMNKNNNMETKLEERINATEELLRYQKTVGGSGLNGSDMLILQNQLAIMKELKEIRLDTKTILGFTAKI
jgi:hypothetical protein